MTITQQLTPKQIARQEAVDNAIHELMIRLLKPKGPIVPWNIEAIAWVRAAVMAYLVDELGLMTEMEFYPYIPTEGLEADTVVVDEASRIPDEAFAAIKPKTDSEKIIGDLLALDVVMDLPAIFEMAFVGLDSAREVIVSEMDLSDKEVSRLRQVMNKFLNGPGQ